MMRILLMYSTHTPSETHVRRLRRMHESICVEIAHDEASAIEAARRAEVIFGHRYLRQVLPVARELKWVQSTAGGVDRLPLKQLRAMGVMLTRMTSAAPVIARHAITLAWAITRRVPEAVERQCRGVWNQDFTWLPFPETAVVFGTGSIGCAIARCLQAEGISTYGVKRAVTRDTHSPFDRLFDQTSWQHILPEVDWCFLALPHTMETRGLFDEVAMRALPAHAVLVNVGRGETLVTSDLREVLREGHLGGAALDVVHPKPQGAGDPLWQVPRLLITPYVAAHQRSRGDAVEHYCEQQMKRYLAGKPLRDQVNLTSNTVSI